MLLSCVKYEFNLKLEWAFICYWIALLINMPILHLPLLKNSSVMPSVAVSFCSPRVQTVNLIWKIVLLVIAHLFTSCVLHVFNSLLCLTFILEVTAVARRLRMRILKSSHCLCFLYVFVQPSYFKPFKFNSMPPGGITFSEDEWI